MARTRSKKSAAAAEPTFVNADRQPDPPDPETLVRVYPSPDLPEGSFLPGVGIAGADVAPELADEWLEAGLATTTAPAKAKAPDLPEGPITDDNGDELEHGAPDAPPTTAPATPADPEV